MKKIAIAAAAAALMSTGAAHAGLTGEVGGPLGGFNIDFDFGNSGPTEISRIIIDGTTAAVTGGTLIWDSFFGEGGTADGAVITGVDTAVAQFDWAVGGFTSGETYSIGVDPDIPGDPFFGADVSDLAGVSVTAYFSDQSRLDAEFVVDGDKLTLTPLAPVPLPASALLLIAGLGGLAVARRKKEAA